MKAATILSSWENVQDVSRANLIFEKRNKSYGGYFIRVFYPDRIFRAFLLAVFGFVLFFNTPLLLEQYFGNAAHPANPIVDNTFIFSDPPPIDKPIIPPAMRQEEIKKQLTAVTKWVRPTVVDEKQNTEEAKAQDDLSKAIIGTETITNDNTEELKLNNSIPIIDDKVYKGYEIQEMPVFPGGDEALTKYLGGIRYPKPASESGIMGIVFVSFVVDKDGKIRDAKIIKGIGGGCDEETIRIVKAMPAWKAGRQNGNPVSVQFNLPVNFKLKY